jgi:hypothetical protein
MTRDAQQASDTTVLIASVAVTGGAGAVAASAADHTAPILAFVGALIVAVITAVTTNRRQAVQLAAEQSLLDLRLSHERALADLADLRGVLESALAAAERATSQLERVSGAPNSDQRAELEAGLIKVSNAANRLRLRLESGDPILVAYLTLVGRVRSMMEVCLSGRSPDTDAYLSAYHEFAAAAVSRTGSFVLRDGQGSSRKA